MTQRKKVRIGARGPANAIRTDAKLPSKVDKAPGSAHRHPRSAVETCRKMVTADEFLLLVLAQLRLQRQTDENPRVFIPDASLDFCFERAYEKLFESGDRLGLILCFSFFCNQLYGNSVMLHDALLAVKLRGLVKRESNGYLICLSEERAQDYIARSSIKHDFLQTIVIDSFTDMYMNLR